MPVIDAATELMAEPRTDTSEEDAVATMLLVFAFTTEAIDVEADVRVDDSAAVSVSVLALTTDAIEEDALATLLSVLAFTTAATEDDADCTSLWVASEPLESDAPVSVRVPEDHTSAARVPKAVSVRVPDDHTKEGISATEDTIVARVEPSDEEAARTMAFVLELTTDATEEDAVATSLSVFALTTAAIDDEAVASAVSVCAFTSEDMPEV